jgi:hypothetical protein
VKLTVTDSRAGRLESVLKGCGKERFWRGMLRRRRCNSSGKRRRSILCGERQEEDCRVYSCLGLIIGISDLLKKVLLKI